MAPAGPAPDVSIVTSGHDVADARLHRLVAAFRRAGLAVEVLGLGDPADGPVGAVTRTRPRAGARGRVLTALAHARAARGRVLVALDPDVLLLLAPLARLRRRRLVADVHEDYAALLHDRHWARGLLGRVAAGVVGTASAAARRSDLVLVADEHVPPHAARARRVVRNLPDPGMLPEPTTPDATPRALYVGDARASRGLLAMLEAVHGAPGWSLDVVGPVDARDADAVAAWLARPGMEARVRLHGRQPPARAWTLARGAWCGLALLEDTPAFREAVPSKLYEYLGCGLPVVVTDLPRQAALVREAGAGEVVPAGAAAGAGAAAVLTGWAADATAYAAAREAALRWRTERLEADPYADAAADVAALARR